MMWGYVADMLIISYRVLLVLGVMWCAAFFVGTAVKGNPEPPMVVDDSRFLSAAVWLLASMLCGALLRTLDHFVDKNGWGT